MARQVASQLILRPAVADDADWAAPLLFSAGAGLFSYIFASSIDEAQTTLHKAFAQPQHAFSYEHTQIVEFEGEAMGLMVGYPAAVKKQADEKVHFIMARLMPLRKLPRILVNVADFNRIKQDISPQDYYLLTIAVAPKAQRCGLGTYLLAQADLRAQQNRCSAICADVAYCNEAAMGLFQRQGYEIRCSKTSDRFAQMTRLGGLHRLVKSFG
jgi:ribosomal protein S18 acetylase RimI-like enzyme